MNGFPFSEEYKSLLTNASDQEILLLHDPFEVAWTKPTTMGDLFYGCRIAIGPLKGDKFAALQATFQKSGATFSVRQRTRRPRALQSLLPKAAMISGNAEAPILMLAASYAATRRPPGGLALEIASDAPVSYGSQREGLDFVEPAAAT